MIIEKPLQRARFSALDGMRGIGALSVVAYHAWPLSSQSCGVTNCNAPFGYLAVDMFFVLSGFVISYSYDPRFLRGMNFREFMVARIVRLYPIFLICALLGALPFIWFALNGQASRGRLVVTLATNLLMLPAPTYPVQPDPYPLVSPAWSLFLEIFVANVSYGLVWKKLTNKLLGWIIGVSLIVLTATVFATGTIDGGSLWATFPVGFPRVLFAFYAGVAVHRLFVHRSPSQVAMPSIILLAVVAATFWPRLHGGPAMVYELFCVTFVYPTLIYLGASARERYPQIGAALGDVSYALYLVHIPILLLILHIAPSYKIDIRGAVPWSLFFVGSVLMAFLINLIYDRPARRVFAKIISRLTV